MNFLKLRDGLLLIATNAITTVEILYREPLSLIVTVANGKAFQLFDWDAKAVLGVIDPPPYTMTAKTAAEAIAPALAIPAETVKTDLEAISYQNPKRHGKKK